MSAARVILPDGSTREFPAGTTVQQVATSIGRRLGEAAIAARVDDKLVDLAVPLHGEAKVAIITKESPEGLEVLRHSTAHLLAHALKELWPTTQITIGPVIEDGFYYDIDCPKQLTVEDFPAIEKRMADIAAKKLPVTREEIPRDQAVEFFRKQGEIYKMELIAGFPAGETVSVYHQGDFTDLCRGPHVPSTERLGKFKLLSVAGAYWRGDETKKMLQRIYGTAFATQKELDEHLVRLEEAKRRDHRKLGPEMGLFTFLPIATAMPFYLPKGATAMRVLADFARVEMAKAGFQEVVCPQLMSNELWKISGHWDHYRDSMFLTGYEEGKPPTLALKPMNCPGHMSLFAATKRSYRELPIRFAELSKLHRNERGGVTHGLLRTRTFSQDDGHIFCTEEQMLPETITTIEHTLRIFKLFGFEKIELKLATRPDKFIGTIENFTRAEEMLATAMKTVGVPFTIADKDGAFYGPKIEFHVQDSLARRWQCGTVQVDFGMPEQFQLEYVDSTGGTKRPVVLHRAILGSFERFFGILLEHHAGHLPFWLAPVQAVVLNVTDESLDYAKRVAGVCTEAGLRVETDFRNEKLGYRIREAQLQRTPLMLVVGDKEKDTEKVSLRWAQGEKAEERSLADLASSLQKLAQPQVGQ